MRRLAAAVAAGAVLALASGTAMAASGRPSASQATTSLASTSPASSTPTGSSTPSSSGTPASATPAPAASARPLCSAEVVDSSGVLSGDQVEQLRSAGQDLAQTTVLRVRTVAGVDGTVTTFEQQLEQSCGWADTSGQRQPTLLVVMVDTDNQQVGIFPGPALAPVLSDKVLRAIEQQAMHQPFTSEDWTTGLQTGIEALDRLVGPGAVPSASFDPSPLATASAATTTAASSPAVSAPASPSSSKGGGFPTLLVVLVVLAIVVVVVVGLGLLRRRSLNQPLASTPGEAWPAEEADPPETEPEVDPNGP